MGKSGKHGEPIPFKGCGSQMAGGDFAGGGPAMSVILPWSNMIVDTHVDKLFWKLVQDAMHSSRGRPMKDKAAEAFGF